MEDNDQWWREGLTEEQRAALDNPVPLPHSYQPYAQSRASAPPPDKKLAGWALGLSFLPCLFTLVPAVVLAIRALARPGDSRANGKGMAIAALCVVGGWAVALTVAVAVDLANDADRDDSGQIEGSGDLDSTDLREGDCFEVPDAEEVLSVDALPCGDAHDAEVFFVFDLPDGHFLGTAPTLRLVEQRCATEFREFVGVGYGDSHLDVYTLTPTRKSWALGDRGATCAAYQPAADGRPTPLTGTLRNARR